MLGIIITPDGRLMTFMGLSMGIRSDGHAVIRFAFSDGETMSTVDWNGSGRIDSFVSDPVPA
jgi:hypothetical protein